MIPEKAVRSNEETIVRNEAGCGARALDFDTALRCIIWVRNGDEPAPGWTNEPASTGAYLPRGKDGESMTEPINFNALFLGPKAENYDFFK